MTRVLLTGASSFTGSWFAHALARAGAEVVAPLRGAHERGPGIRARRLQRVAAAAEIIPFAPSGSDRLMEIVSEGPPFDLLCLHAAEVGDFKSPAYDAYEAFARNMHGLVPLLRAAAERGCRRVLVTGSLFEADEGVSDPWPSAIGAYGLAKTLTWQAQRHECERLDLALGKFVIPNPFGPDEKPGLVSHLIGSWLRGVPAMIMHPELVRDHVPIRALASDYARMALGLPSTTGLYRRNPSGFIETIGAFALRVAAGVGPHLGRPCPIQHAARSPESRGAMGEPRLRHNTDAVLESLVISDCWRDLAQCYLHRECIENS